MWRALGPILVGIVVGLIYATTAPHSASGDFYSAASQVIPVLMLALIIESRVFTAPLRSALPPPRRKLGPIAQRFDPYFFPVIVGCTVALMGLGELSALATLGSTDYRTADPFEGYFTVGFGAGTIATLPFWNVPPQTR
jgi:hypothetical protein